MRLTYAAQARIDLDAIADYLNAKSPAGAKRIALQIDRAVKRLARHPMIGRAQTTPSVRKAVEPRYGYLIYYAISAEDDEIVILTIRHPARARSFEDE